MTDNFFIQLYENNIETRHFVKNSNEQFKIKLTLNKNILPGTVKFYYGNDNAVIKNGIVIDESGIDSNTFVAEFNEKTAGLYFFHFEIIRDDGLIFLSPSGISKKFCGEWQILCINRAYPIPKFGNGIIYHIFVDRFFKYGNVPLRKDAVLQTDWNGGIPDYAEKQGGHLNNNNFFGGTLFGIAEKIEYIKALGTDCIYLSPIFKAYSNHKYDTGDYLHVDEMFGGDEALKNLIAVCKSNGIRLILDGVFNHVGDDSVYFNKYGNYNSIGAYQSPDSPYSDWFTLKNGKYDCWWGVKALPKVNKTSSFRDFICNVVIPKYMDMGVDGWRLDVVDEYTNDFTEQIVAAIKSKKSDAIIIGEVWENASNKVAYGERKSYFYGKSLDSVMNYPFRSAVLEFLKSADNSHITQIVKTITASYPQKTLPLLMNMLGTHDTERIITVLGGDSSNGKSNKYLSLHKMTAEQRKNATALLFAAYALISALPGKVSVYYGDEVGLEGYHDPFNRMPFPWGNEDFEILNYIKKVNHCKQNCETLLNGETIIIPSAVCVFLFVRTLNGNEVFCACNMGESDYEIGFNAKSLISSNAISTIKPKSTEIYTKA
ncbi:MAG: glycoside hydrolase family 13 protein [Clostridia bacterium]